MGKSSFDLATDDCGIHGEHGRIYGRVDLRRDNAFAFYSPIKMPVSPKA